MDLRETISRAIAGVVLEPDFEGDAESEWERVAHVADAVIARLPATPSPDIAGLVERLELGVPMSHPAGKTIDALLNEVATALQRVAQERDAAMADRDSHQREAIRLMGELDALRKRFDEHSEYSVDLQRIIEALGKGRAPALPRTTARFHYDIAVGFHLANKARLSSARE